MSEVIVSKGHGTPANVRQRMLAVSILSSGCFASSCFLSFYKSSIWSVYVNGTAWANQTSSSRYSNLYVKERV